jgi:hypothetical protein
VYKRQNLFKALYIIAIGVLVAAFIGFGVETFYSTPSAPDYPSINYSSEGRLSEEDNQKQKDFDKEQKIYQEQLSQHNQIASIILIVLAVFLLAVSILWLGKIEIIGDGLTLGGVLTLFYGIFRAILTQEEVFRFVAVGVGLFVILALTYWKFLKPAQAKSNK